MASSPQPIPIYWAIQQINVGGQTISIARLQLALSFLDNSGQRSGPYQGWFDSGAPLSIVPYRIHRHLVWQRIGVQVTWAGLPCELGRIDLWFHDSSGTEICGPLSILAKFPHRELAGDPVPVLFGLDFLLAYQAQLSLSPPPTGGSIQLP